MRAQSATEYLATYGWALLLIAVALSALLYFGLVNPLFFVGQQCLLPAGFACTIVGMTTNGQIMLNIYQSMGPSINITAVGCSSNDSFANIPAYSGNQIVLRSGANKTVQMQCYSGSSTLYSPVGSAFMGYVLINYTQPSVSGFSHTASGKLLAKPASLLLATSSSTTSSTTSTSTTSTSSTSTSTTSTSSTSTSTTSSSTTSLWPAPLNSGCPMDFYYCNGGQVCWTPNSKYNGPACGNDGNGLGFSCGVNYCPTATAQGAYTCVGYSDSWPPCDTSPATSQGVCCPYGTHGVLEQTASYGVCGGSHVVNTYGCAPN
jgi:hypothetical protein